MNNIKFMAFGTNVIFIRACMDEVWWWGSWLVISFLWLITPYWPTLGKSQPSSSRLSIPFTLKPKIPVENHHHSIPILNCSLKHWVGHQSGWACCGTLGISCSCYCTCTCMHNALSGSSGWVPVGENKQYNLHSMGLACVMEAAQNFKAGNTEKRCS